jgi:hypothetical protein
LVLKSKVEGVDLNTLPSPLHLKNKILLKVIMLQTILTARVNTSLPKEMNHSKESPLHRPYRPTQKKNLIQKIILRNVLNHQKSKSYVPSPLLPYIQHQPTTIPSLIHSLNSSITSTPFPNENLKSSWNPALMNCENITHIT